MCLCVKKLNSFAVNWFRWWAKSFYIYGCGDNFPEGSGLTANKSDGCTITFKKRGGVQKAWDLTKQVAKYP